MILMIFGANHMAKLECWINEARTRKYHELGNFAQMYQYNRLFFPECIKDLRVCRYIPQIY